MSNLLDQSKAWETFHRPFDLEIVGAGLILAGLVLKFVSGWWAALIILVLTFIYEWKIDGVVVKIKDYSDDPKTPWEWNDPRDIFIGFVLAVILKWWWS